MKKKFVRSARKSDEMSLQITSMADIFTIILVFLLKSYATGTVNVTPSPGTLLPEAHAAESTADALKIEVSTDAVLVEGQPVTKLEQFRAPGNDVLANGALRSLSAAVEKERKRQLIIAKSNPDVKVDARVMIIADQRAPYSTIKEVLASAATQGYTDYKLAVVNGE